MVVDERAPPAGGDLPLAGEAERRSDRVPRPADGADERTTRKTDASKASTLAVDGDASTREGDEEGRGGQADPESRDDERLGIGCVDAPDVERAGKAGRGQQDQEEPEVRGLQRPGSAAEQARGACPETDPAGSP